MKTSKVLKRLNTGRNHHISFWELEAQTKKKPIYLAGYLKLFYILFVDYM